ncbi:MAG TPA: MerR family transcriptional regulator [Solirubrobacteraceae bacterium]|jgi:DNA-binding transcriptional MerR regulator
MVGTVAAEEMTIEQLAAASGMTVRNIRAHRARGLLGAPEVRDRVGYYAGAHLARLRLIAQMQSEGFNLAAIGRVLEQTDEQPEPLLNLRRTLHEPFDPEQAQVLSLAELRERLGEAADLALLEEAVSKGILIPLGEDRFEVPAPSLLEAAQELMAIGVPLKRVMATDTKVRAAAQRVAAEFVRLYLKEVWEPFARQGYPRERWPEVQASIERLRPLASRVLLASFGQTMSAQVDEALGRELARLAGE